MTDDDAKTYFGVISPAADAAVALARLVRCMTGRGRYDAEAGGLGIGHTADAAGGSAIVVDRRGKRCLRVVQPAAPEEPRAVMPFDNGGPWVRELADTLHGLQRMHAADRARPAGKPS